MNKTAIEILNKYLDATDSDINKDLICRAMEEYASQPKPVEEGKGEPMYDLKQVTKAISVAYTSGKKGLDYNTIRKNILETEITHSPTVQPEVKEGEKTAEEIAIEKYPDPIHNVGQTMGDRYKARLKMQRQAFINGLNYAQQFAPSSNVFSAEQVFSEEQMKNCWKDAQYNLGGNPLHGYDTFESYISKLPPRASVPLKPAVTLKEVKELNVLEDKLIDAIAATNNDGAMNAFLAWQEKRNDMNENRLTIFEDIIKRATDESAPSALPTEEKKFSWKQLLAAYEEGGGGLLPTGKLSVPKEKAIDLLEGGLPYIRDYITGTNIATLCKWIDTYLDKYTAQFTTLPPTPQQGEDKTEKVCDRCGGEMEMKGIFLFCKNCDNE